MKTYMKDTIPTKIVLILCIIQASFFSFELVIAQNQGDQSDFERYEERINEALMNDNHEELQLLLGSFTDATSSSSTFEDDLFGNEFGMAGLNERVLAITEYQDTFCIGGEFTSFNSDTQLGRVACFNETEGSWDPLGLLDGQVQDLQVYDGDLYAGGYFTSSDETELNYIARWDGSEWETVSSGFDGPVESLTVHNGKLVAAGRFQRALSTVSFGSELFTGTYTVEQQQPSNSTAGSFGNGWIFFEQKQFDVELQETETGRKFTAAPSPATGLDLPEREYRLLFLESENIVTLEERVPTRTGCGSIEGVIYSTAVDSFGTFNPQNDNTFTFSVRENSNLECNFPAEDILFTATKTASKNKNISAGSIFQNGIATWDGESWEGFGDGFIDDNSFSNIPNITDLLSVNDTLYVSGNFTGSGDTDLNSSVAYWNETNKEWMPVGNSLGENITTPVLTWYNDKLVVGTNQQLPDSELGAVNKWNSTTKEWEPLGFNFNVSVRDLHVKDGQLYAGTRGLSSSNEIANGLARWDEISESWVGDVSAEVNVSSVEVVSTVNEELMVGGSFFDGEGTSRNPVRNVAWIEQNGNMLTKEDLDFSNTNGLTSFGGLNPGLGMDSYVFENNIIVGGSFDYAGSVPANNIALWNGSNWEALGEGLEGSIRSMVTFEGQLHAANLQGSVGSPGGQVSRWNSSTEQWEPLGDPLVGVSETGDPLSIGIWRLEVYNDSLYAAGQFNKEAGSHADLIAKWNPGTETWEEVGEGFQGGLVRARGLTVYNGELYAGGNFSSSGDIEINNVARWDEVTRTWQPVGDGFDLNVRVLTLLDGELHAAGGFGISRWDESCQTWVPRNQGLDESAVVSSLDEYNGEFFAGAGAQNTHLYHWDNELKEWSSLASGTNDIVYRMAGLNGKLHIPGWFTEAGGKPAYGFTTFDVETATTTEEVNITEQSNQIELRQNYPNPFNPTTQISYSIPRSENVVVEVFNVMGQRVVTLFSGRQSPGLHSVTFDASSLSSGIYIYRLTAGNITETKKMLLVK